MTDDDKALVKWLRDEASFAYDREDMGMLNQAAARIEALIAGIDRLVIALNDAVKLIDEARTALGKEE